MQPVESAVESLQAEIFFYRQNHSILESEIRTLINDNRHLSGQVESLLKERADLPRSGGGGSGGGEDSRAGLDDLQNQISLLTKERDSLLQLWQTSQRTIDALETELKTYQSEYYRQDDDIRQDQPRNSTQLNRDHETKFNTALEEINNLEIKLEQELSNVVSTANALKLKEDEANSCKEHRRTLEVKIEEVLAELEQCKRHLANELKSNEELTLKYVKSETDVQLSVRREAEAKSKVMEALDLLDAVAAQRDDACAKAAAFAEELALVKETVRQVTSEIEARLRAELDEVKEKYDEKIADMLTHVQTLDAELVEKGLMLARMLRENRVLQKTNDSYAKQHADAACSLDPRLAAAERRLDAAFQELVLSERRNIQLVSEKQCIALDMQRLRDSHSRDMKRRDWEEKLLRTEIADFKLQIEHLQKSLKETHAMVSKLQALLSSKSDLNEKIVTSKEVEVVQLNEHVQKQIDLNKKWRKSYVDMTESLKSRLEELYTENQSLKSHINPSQEHFQAEEYELLKTS